MRRRIKREATRAALVTRERRRGLPLLLLRSKLFIFLVPYVPLAPVSRGFLGQSAACKSQYRPTGPLGTRTKLDSLTRKISKLSGPEVNLGSLGTRKRE